MKPEKRKKNFISLYFFMTRDPISSLIFSLPILLFYNIGIIISPKAMNGADFLTKTLFTKLTLQWYLLLNGVIFLLLIILIPYLKKKGRLNTKYFFPVVIESFIYAILMGNIILLIMKKAHLFGPSSNLSVFEALVVSAGAGFHEELFFRFILMGGLFLLFKSLLKSSRVLPYLISIILSSILFSLAHYIVEPFEFFSFIYRTLGGVYFSLLFISRGFGVSSYTHFLYDVIVLVF